MKYHLVNFHDYALGRKIRFGTSKAPRPTSGRIVLGSKPWILILDQTPGYAAYRKNLATHGGFVIGHAGTVSRRNRAAISVRSHQVLSDELHFFFAFLCGRRCGPVIAQGLGKDRVVWTEWQAYRLNSSTMPHAWLPEHRVGDLEGLFDGFHRLWHHRAWRGSLRNVIHWYVEANTGAGALEGALILSCTAMELIGWLELVETRLVLTGPQFDRQDADDRMRRVLKELGIPTEIPNDSSYLKRMIGRRSITDGPGAIIAIRNALVHPYRNSRLFVKSLHRMERFQALQLALSYVELSILRLIGYSGHYSRRVYPYPKPKKTGNRIVIPVGQQLSKVPWA